MNMPKEELDEDTQKILEDMKKDGADIDDDDDTDSDDDKDKDIAKEDDDDSVEDDESDDIDDDDDEEDGEEKKKDKKDDKDEDDTEDEDDSDEDDSDKLEDADPIKRRPIVTIPIHEVKRERRQNKRALGEANQKIADLQKQLAAASTGPEKKQATEDALADMKALSEEYGISPEFTAKLVEKITKGITLPADVQKRLDAVEVVAQEREKKLSERKELKAALDSFGKEFASLAKSNPEVAGFKQQLKDLAFSKKYHTYAIEDIWHLHQKTLKPTRRSTMEDGRGGSSGRGSKAKDAKDVAGDDIMGMSDKEFEEFSEEQAKGSGGRFIIKRKGNQTNG